MSLSAIYPVEQRLTPLRVSEAVHSDDAAEVLEYNNLQSCRRAKIDTLVADSILSSIMQHCKHTRLSFMYIDYSPRREL